MLFTLGLPKDSDTKFPKELNYWSLFDDPGIEVPVMLELEELGRAVCTY